MPSMSPTLENTSAGSEVVSSVGLRGLSGLGSCSIVLLEDVDEEEEDS